MNISNFITLQNIATVYLILMSIQYVPIEGHGVSMIKLGAMCLAPFIFISSQRVISKALVLGLMYYLMVVLSAIFNPASFRISTLGYHFSFLFMFVTFYGLIHYCQVHTSESFVKVLKGLILAYTILLLVQQFFMVLGIKSTVILNNYKFLDRGLGANSLSLEPSHSARIMVIAFLCLLRMYEIKFGEAVSIGNLLKEAKWTSLGFLWSMLTMGSGTAFVALGILSIYFIKKQYAFTVVPFIIGFYFLIPFIQVESLQRAYRTTDAFMDGDQKVIAETDGSAAGRINPLLNTIQYLDVTDIKTWVGNGIDTKLHSKRPFIGCIQDYGLLAFIFMQWFIYACVIRRFISLETVFWIFIFGMAFQNFAYTFSVMMMMSATRYFQERGTWIEDKVLE